MYEKLKLISRALVLLLVTQTAFFSCNTQNRKLKTIDLSQQWDTLRVLKNPHKGWYHHLLDNGISKYQITDDSLFYSFPGMDHLYLRLAWSYLEPEEGVFDWHYIDDVVKKFVPSGYGISFRITCKETGTWPGSVGHQHNGVMYATPVWVEKAGAKGTVTEAWGTRSWTPKWDDPVFLQKLDNFHHRFAERYDGKPWVRYVDIGSIGEWGEGHTSFSTKVPPTPDEVTAHVDLHLKHYKMSQLVVTDDLLYYGKPKEDQLRLLDYAISKGITVRDDSPMVEWYLQQNIDTWSVSHPHMYDPLYLTRPIIFELQHYHMVKRDGNWKGPNGSEVIPSLGYSGAEIMKKAIPASTLLKWSGLIRVLRLPTTGLRLFSGLPLQPMAKHSMWLLKIRETKTGCLATIKKNGTFLNCHHHCKKVNIILNSNWLRLTPIHSTKLRQA